MKEYKSLILNGYTTDKFLNKHFDEMVEQGYQLVLVTIRNDILIFEREKDDKKHNS